jgi:hypothetical protein
MADFADQAGHVARPRIDEDLDTGSERETQAHAGHRYDDCADGAQTSESLGIEALEGFREPAIPLALNRPHEVLRAFRIGPLDLLDRPIEVSEDPAHLFLDQAEGHGPERVDCGLGRFPQRARRETVSRLERLGDERNLGHGDEIRLRRNRIRVPSGRRYRRDENPMEVLPLLIGHQRHSERELKEDGRVDIVHLAADPGFRAEVALRQSVLNPIARGRFESGDIPTTAADGEGNDLLEEVAARGEEFRSELSHTIGVQGHHEGRGDLELGPQAIRHLSP